MQIKTAALLAQFRLTNAYMAAIKKKKPVDKSFNSPLQLNGSYNNIYFVYLFDSKPAGHKISEERYQESQLQQGRSRQRKRRPEQKNEKQAERMPVITKSKRRKLERIKAPVVLLRKMTGAEGK